MIRCVVFDFDGTLVDTNAIKREAFYEVVDGDPDAISALVEALETRHGATRHDIFAMVAARLHGENQAAARRLAKDMVRRYTMVTTNLVATCPEIPGAESVMDALLKQGCILALNSATLEDALLDILRRRGWRARFRLVRGAPTTKADNLRRLAVDLGVPRDDMVMVGDRESDRRCAADAECPFIAVLRPDSDFVDPLPRHIDRLSELPAAMDAGR